MNFILSIVLSAIAVLILVVIPWVGVGALNLSGFFGVFLPYVALIVFFVGLVYRVVVWACSPSPFRIPTTAGQQWSLPGSSTTASTTPRARSGC